MSSYRLLYCLPLLLRLVASAHAEVASLDGNPALQRREALPVPYPPTARQQYSEGGDSDSDSDANAELPPLQHNFLKQPHKYNQRYYPSLSYNPAYAQIHRAKIDHADEEGGLSKASRTAGFSHLNDLFVNDDAEEKEGDEKTNLKQGDSLSVPHFSRLLGHALQVQRARLQQQRNGKSRPLIVNGKLTKEAPESFKTHYAVLRAVGATHPQDVAQALMWSEGHTKAQIAAQKHAAHEPRRRHRQKWLANARYDQSLAAEHFDLLWPRAKKVGPYLHGIRRVDHKSEGPRAYLDPVQQRLNMALGDLNKHPEIEPPTSHRYEKLSQNGEWQPAYHAELQESGLSTGPRLDSWHKAFQNREIVYKHEAGLALLPQDQRKHKVKEMFTSERPSNPLKTYQGASASPPAQANRKLPQSEGRAQQHPQPDFNIHDAELQAKNIGPLPDGVLDRVKAGHLFDD